MGCLTLGWAALCCLVLHAGGLQRSRRLRGEAECCEWLCRGTGIGLHPGVWVWMVPVHGGVFAWGYGFRRHGCLAWLGRPDWVVRIMWDENEKGIGWMPWRQEAMKDVARCEKPGGAASGL